MEHNIPCVLLPGSRGGKDGAPSLVTSPHFLGQIMSANSSSVIFLFLVGLGMHHFNQLSEQEDLIVWMRTAALPSFRKLYGRIEEDLDVDDVVVVDVSNNYNTYSFGGKKKLVLSTSSWLGGKNDFLGMAYLSVGSSSILLSLIFLLLHVKNPR